MERRVLRPSPDLPCPCGAATHTALCAPRRSCHWFLLYPPSSRQPAVCQYAFSMAATASDPIRPSSQGVVTVRYNERPAIGCSVMECYKSISAWLCYKLFNMECYKSISASFSYRLFNTEWQKSISAWLSYYVYAVQLGSLLVQLRVTLL